MNNSDRNHKEKYLTFLLSEYRRLRFEPKERDKVFHIPIGGFANLAMYMLPKLTDNSIALLYHVCKSKRIALLSRCEPEINKQLIQLVHIDGLITPVKLIFTDEILDVSGTGSKFDKKTIYKGYIANARRLGILPEDSVVYAACGYLGEANQVYHKLYFKV